MAAARKCCSCLQDLKASSARRRTVGVVEAGVVEAGVVEASAVLAGVVEAGVATVAVQAGADDGEPAVPAARLFSATSSTPSTKAREARIQP